MPHQRERTAEDPGTTGPRPVIARWDWCWLLVIPTVIAVIALFVVHAVGAAWPSATGAALSTWAITGAAIAAFLRRDRR